MKKIILAVASVLALGLFASCQREISGDLNVNETTLGATQTVDTYTDFDVTGTITDTTKVTRKVGTADEGMHTEAQRLHNCRYVCTLFRTNTLFCSQTAAGVDSRRKPQTADDATRQGAHLYRDIKRLCLCWSAFQIGYSRTIVCV